MGASVFWPLDSGCLLSTLTAELRTSPVLRFLAGSVGVAKEALLLDGRPDEVVATVAGTKALTFWLPICWKEAFFLCPDESGLLFGETVPDPACRDNDSMSWPFMEES